MYVAALDLLVETLNLDLCTAQIELSNSEMTSLAALMRQVYVLPGGSPRVEKETDRIPILIGSHQIFTYGIMFCFDQCTVVIGLLQSLQ